MMIPIFRRIIQIKRIMKIFQAQIIPMNSKFRKMEIFLIISKVNKSYWKIIKLYNKINKMKKALQSVTQFRLIAMIIRRVAPV